MCHWYFQGRAWQWFSRLFSGPEALTLEVCCWFFGKPPLGLHCSDCTSCTRLTIGACHETGECHWHFSLDHLIYWRSTVTGKFLIIKENYTRIIRPRMSTRGVRKLWLSDEEHWGLHFSTCSWSGMTSDHFRNLVTARYWLSLALKNRHAQIKCFAWAWFIWGLTNNFGPLLQVVLVWVTSDYHIYR